MKLFDTIIGLSLNFKQSTLHFIRRTLVLALLLFGVVIPTQIQAQTYYVFYNSTYGYIYNNGGTPAVSTTFTKSSIWAASGALGNTGRNIYSYTATSQYLRGGTNGTNLTLGNTQNNWRTRSSVLNYNNNNNGFVHYNGSALVCSNGNTRFTPYNFTINNNQAAINPTINITVASGLSNDGIQLTSNVTGTYAPACTTAVVRNYNDASTQTYYWTSSTEASTTRPGQITDWSNATKSWVVTTGGAYASVNSDGLVTITGNPTGNVVVTLTVSKDGYSGNKTFTLTRAAMAQTSNTVSTINSLNVSPSSAALYVNQSQAFTASATVNTTTNTTPAHTTLTGDGNTYYYYSGTLYTNTEDFSTTSTTTADPTFTWSKTGDDISNASLSATSGASTTLTHSTGVSADKSITLTVQASYTGATPQSKSVQVNLYAPFVEPTITRSGNNIILSTNSLGATIYYTTDGTIPSASNGTAYRGPFSLEDLTLPVTVKAIAIRGGENTEVAQQTYNNLSLEKPTIIISSAGAVTITSTTAGASIRYTTDGTNPTSTSGTVYNGSFNVSNLTTVKAIAYKTGYDDSEVASELYVTSGVTNDKKVILNDREDHSWSYYSDASLPAQLHSLSPADVKITYYGNGTNTVATSNDANPGNSFTASTDDAVKVGIDASEGTFVYYKTLERTDGSTSDNPTGRCLYTTIPNPFSVRPTYGTDGTTKYRGFYTWRVKSVSGGTIYNASTGGNVIAVGGTIDAETEIYFAPTSEYGMEVEFEALWARAYVGGNYSSDVTYERNFVIGGAAVNYPATYSAIYPNGTTNGTDAATSVTGTYDPGAARTLSYDSKFEYINLTGNRTYTANNHYLCFGRGISTANNAGTVQGINQYISGTTNYSDLDYMLRVESGKFNTLTFVRDGSATVSGRYLVKAIMGCDYDRATNANDKLSISAGSTLFFSRTAGFSGSINKDQKTFDCVFKSGKFQENYWNETDQSGTNAYQRIAYLGPNGAGTTYPGTRCVTVEGGELGGMCGGRAVNNTSNNSSYMTPEVITFDLRIKGGIFHGGVFGGAADNPSIGSRRFIMTGGEIWSWLAGGCNGTGSQGGQGSTDGNSYIYVGGHALVGGDHAMSIQSTAGGQVFGAGRGLDDSRTSSVNYSHVAIADEAVVSNNVYGGSYNGTVVNEANVYILGGTVKGGVYGGSYGNATGSPVPVANVKMTGGLVNGGVYGGSNSKGTVGNVEMHIDGGQVGISGATANIHGGGYGQNTVVTGNVDLTLGVQNQTEPGVTVYGDVYGGSALGSVNGTSASDTYHTNVTLNAGTIYGSLYGGALGDNSTPANVYAPVTVTVNGGSVKKTDADGANGSGAVYGCNNINGAPQRAVAVIINGTDPAPSADEYALFAVYGGGNKASYAAGTPTVTVNNCDNSIEYVYGGGNAAHITNGNTDVKIYGGDKIGNVFGGGNGTVTAANVSGNTSVNIYGGTIGRVFGGSNSAGTIGGTINVAIAKNSTCPMHIDEVYGGGNMAASNAGNVSISCTGGEGEGIGDVYGGANAADITGNITLNVTGGSIQRVFGGNNTSGTIDGNVQVNVNWDTDPCGYNYLGSVFGGGNVASYSGTPDVNIINGTVSHNVYGGGNEAGVGGGDVEMTGGTVLGGIYGGCNTSGTVTGDAIVTLTGGTVGAANAKANVHGGGFGEATNVAGAVNVYVGTLTNGTYAGDVTIYGDVYGGSALGKVNATASGEPATYSHTSGKNTNVYLYRGAINGDVFGGGLGEKTGVNGGTSNVEAIVYGDVTVTLDGAKIVTSYNSETGSVTSGCIFGANNINGTPKGHVKVLVKNTAEVSGQAIDVASVFGGGSLATYVPSVANDYTEVEINKTAGNGSRVVVGNVYGGGNQAGIGQGSIITGTQVKLISGDVKSGLYGGSNKEGTVTGDATVTLTGGTVGANGAKANVHGGGYGEDTNVAGAVNVYVGTSSNSGNAVIYGDVYGGSALGKVNATATTSGTTTTYSHTAGKNTSVNLLGGTIHGDAYGGGLGQRQGFNGAESSIAALVYGNVTVTLNGTKFDVTTVSDGSNDVPASGRVFGCNNLFGSPMGTVLVYVASTSPLSGGGHTKSVYDANGNITTNNYEVQAVYGGGNLAAYEPTDPEANGQYSTNHTASEKPVQVVIDACGEASIEYVYGGGNAAPVPATDVLILGSYEIGNVFGGGNGKDKYYNGSQWNVNEGADVGIKGASHDALGKATGGTTYGSGEALATVLGGTIHSVFGASNTKGDIIKSAQVVLGDENLETCNFELDEIYGGGNEAYMSGSADIDMNCIEGLNQIYGGSKKADINGDVVLNITGGTYGKVFGGNNISGTIYGTITVNIEEKGCLPIKIGELYGGGNQAAYSVENIPSARKTSLGDNYVNYPQVNVISATEIGTIYGGGLGGSAVVTGNPHVNINMKQGSVNGEYVYKDGVSPTGYDAYTSAGTLPLGTIGTVFGGGNAAQVNGSTYVNIGDQTFVNENNQPVPSDAQITGNVFGGGNNAVVTGSTHVQIGPTPAP